jgi:bidirectional [NiFe] hydrogenase diaphorase subunit
MLLARKKPDPPSDDKRWKLVDVTMRRNGYTGHALIETLHTVQSSFGYIDDVAMRFVGQSLGLPLSKVYGVATFYHLFSLKPQGRHACVVCTGTACYIKGAGDLLDGIKQRYQVGPGETTMDDRFSVLSARCLGACGLAPAAVVDGQVLGKVETKGLLARLEELT